jgi:hypothetical protein
MISEREPFDPADPKDAMCEMFRRIAIDNFTDARSVTLFREMTLADQLKCFMTGSLVGLLCIGLGAVKRRDAGAMMSSVESGLPACREMAESILDDAGWK